MASNSRCVLKRTPSDHQALPDHTDPALSVKPAGSGVADVAAPDGGLAVAPCGDQHVLRAGGPCNVRSTLSGRPSGNSADGASSLLLGDGSPPDGTPALPGDGSQLGDAGWLADVSSATTADGTGAGTAKGGMAVSKAAPGDSPSAGLRPGSGDGLAAADTAWLSDVRPASGSGSWGVSPAVGFGSTPDAGLSSLLHAGVRTGPSAIGDSPAGRAALAQSPSRPLLSARSAGPSSPGFVHGIPRLNSGVVVGGGRPVVAGFGTLAGLGAAAALAPGSQSVGRAGLSGAPELLRQSSSTAAAASGVAGTLNGILQERAVAGSPLSQGREGSGAGASAAVAPVNGAALSSLSGSGGAAASNASSNGGSGVGGAPVSLLGISESAIGPRQHGTVVAPYHTLSHGNGSAAWAPGATSSTATDIHQVWSQPHRSCQQQSSVVTGLEPPNVSWQTLAQFVDGLNIAIGAATCTFLTG